MKIISAKQTQALDTYTIENEPVSSIDLMERAALAFTTWFMEQFDYENRTIHIFCGPGNNGGDGLAIARLLHHGYYTVQLYLCQISENTSSDYRENLSRIPKHHALPISIINVDDDFPSLPEDAILIDGIFGSGLNRPVTAYWEQFIQFLNKQNNLRISIDIPSGLFADQHTSSIAFKADHTFCFELPKLAFMFPENHLAVGSFEFRSIGLSSNFLSSLTSSNFYIDKGLIQGILKPRKKFDHKGSFGHVLLVAGSYGMLGAAMLAAKSALRGGAGLVSLHVPKIAYAIVQISIPEVMVSIDQDDHFISQFPVSTKYQAIGIGPGLGNNPKTIKALSSFITSYTLPIVLDADALNIIAKAPHLLEKLPKGSILTPHPKEFERLFGYTKNDFERHHLQLTKAQSLGIYIILKGAHTCIACPDGACYFNSTGNPGMATGGSGDVLTGLITSLLGQGYAPKDAAILGVYLHGLAGDLAAKKIGHQVAIVASDIVDCLGFAFGAFEKY